MSAALFRGLGAGCLAAACTSRCAVCITRGMRTAATVKFSIPLDPDGHKHPPTSGFVKLSKRDWKTYTPKPPSLIQTRSVDLEPEIDDEPDETLHPGFLRKKVQRKSTPPEATAHRETIKGLFPEGWSPPHKLSRQAMDGLRVLHMHDPQTFTTPVLAAKFRISPEAVRRILKSKWEPSVEQKARLARREMRDKEEWIRQRRIAEKREFQALEQNHVREEFKKGRAVGANSKDSLSLV